MSEEEALLQAISANPDEDTPRLVYADWLDEHGQPERAEFIRVQIELARLDGGDRPDLREREQQLYEAKCAEWALAFGPFNAVKVSVAYIRGFPEHVSFGNADPADFETLRRLPGLRGVHVETSRLAPSALRLIAKLRQLDRLTIYDDTPFRVAWLRLLDPLPFWTYVRIDSNARGFERAWDEFQEQRIGKLARAPFAKRREGALRFVAAVNGTTVRSVQSVKSASFPQTEISDAELRLVSNIGELEAVHIYQGNETETGLRHLARLPNLKSVELLRSPINSIVPLTRCTKLESLWVSADGGTITDDGTEGLDLLTHLCKLQLYGGGDTLRDGTVRRLASLKNLRSLELYIGELEEDSLSAIAGHTKLESARIEGPVTDDDIRHFAGLTNLTFLSLNGNRATDTGLLHLGRLTKLRTLMAQSGFMGDRSQITEAAARSLADQLPNVTIILDGCVVKSPRTTITFQRRQAGDFASALFPLHWKGDPDQRCSIRLTEDGWEHVGSWSGGVVGPGGMQLYVADDEKGNSAETAMTANVQNNSHANPRILERDVVKLPYRDVASCIYRNDFGQHLVCAVASGSQRAVLTCDAPASRFEEFRPLFLYVVRSVRVGKAALKNVGEEKTVAVSRL